MNAWSAVVTPESTYLQFLANVGLLRRMVYARAVRYALHPAQWGVLVTLHRCEGEGRGPLRIGELGERLLIRPPSVSTVVTRLVGMGLVARVALEGEARLRGIGLTAEGRRLLESRLPEHHAWVDSLLRPLSEIDRVEFIGLLRRLESHWVRLAEEEDAAAAGVSGAARAGSAEKFAQRRQRA